MAILIGKKSAILEWVKIGRKKFLMGMWLCIYRTENCQGRFLGQF